MLRVLNVLVAVHAAQMARHKPVALMDTHPVRIGFERQEQTCVARWHREVIGVQRHAKLLGGTYCCDPCQIKTCGVEAAQLGATKVKTSVAAVNPGGA